MALPIPLILAAGAAVLLLGGKKKKSGSSTATSTRPGSRPSQADIEEVLAMFNQHYAAMEQQAKITKTNLSTSIDRAAAAKVPGSSKTYGQVAKHVVDVLGNLDSRFNSPDVFGVLVSSFSMLPNFGSSQVTCTMNAKTFEAVMACLPL
jgi:hypothetical protein